ncbi:MAG: YiaA/YiaB family inner membrane protein [Pikeienuella sp.]
MNTHTQNSKGWIFFTMASFVIAVGATLIGAWMTDMTLEMKGFVSMGVLLITSSSFTLAKTMRDEHEAKRFHHQIEEARTEKLLREVDAS